MDIPLHAAHIVLKSTFLYIESKNHWYNMSPGFYLYLHTSTDTPTNQPGAFFGKKYIFFMESANSKVKATNRTGPRCELTQHRYIKSIHYYTGNRMIDFGTVWPKETLVWSIALWNPSCSNIVKAEFQTHCTYPHTSSPAHHTLHPEVCIHQIHDSHTFLLEMQI